MTTEPTDRRGEPVSVKAMRRALTGRTQGFIFHATRNDCEEVVDLIDQQARRIAELEFELRERGIALAAFKSATPKMESRIAELEGENEKLDHLAMQGQVNMVTYISNFQAEQRRAKEAEAPVATLRTGILEAIDLLERGDTIPTAYKRLSAALDATKPEDEG